MDADPEPGNYGGPFWVTLDMPYIDYDFATGESGEPFDCRRPVNDSALNTGRRVLPPLVQPDVWYTYEDTGLFPELFQNMGGDGIGPPAGPAYQFNAKSRSRFKWPRYYHGVPRFYEWTARLHQGVSAQPSQRVPAGGDPARPGVRRQPDGHGVRP